MTCAGSIRAEFTPEASDRLKILVDEVKQRLDEIGQLAAVVKGSPLEVGTKVKFVETSGSATFSADNPWLIEILDLPDGTTCCAVWAEAGQPAKLYCPC